MNTTSEHQEHVRELMRNGEKLEAVRYLQEHFKLSADQALSMAEMLDRETEDEDFSIDQTPLVESTVKGGISVGRIVGGVFLGVGLILLIVCYFLWNNQATFSETAISVNGVVIQLEERSSRNSDTGSWSYTYAPVVRYDVNGKEYVYHSTSSSNPPSYAVDEEVTLLVDPKNPNDVVIDDFMDRWFAPVLLGAMGAIFSTVGFFVFRKA